MIRAYHPNDADQIVDVWRIASDLAHPFLSPAFVEQEQKNVRELYLPNTKTWVLEEQERVIGFISMIGNEVGAIFLYPQYHGRGFGKQMMDTVAKQHPNLKVEVFKANKIGRAFYDKYGFLYQDEYFHEPSQQQMLRLQYTS